MVGLHGIAIKGKIKELNHNPVDPLWFHQIKYLGIFPLANARRPCSNDRAKLKATITRDRVEPLKDWFILRTETVKIEALH